MSFFENMIVQCITAKFLTTSFVLAQMYKFSLNLSSLQQKFSLTSNYLGTNSTVVKRIDCNNLQSRVPTEIQKHNSMIFQ